MSYAKDISVSVLGRIKFVTEVGFIDQELEKFFIPRLTKLLGTTPEVSGTQNVMLLVVEKMISDFIELYQGAENYGLYGVEKINSILIKNLEINRDSALLELVVHTPNLTFETGVRV